MQTSAVKRGGDQTWDVDATASALEAAPAFTKVGAGTLTLHGTNTYLCATCVSNGTLTVTGTVWPGYPDAGTLTVKEATLAPAKLAYVLDEEGACGQLAVNGPLDLTGVEISVDNLANKGKGAITLVTAQSITGTPTCDQPEAIIYANGNTVRLCTAGTTVIIR